MRLTGPAQRLTIFIGESDRWHHHSLTTEILQRAHRAGLAGASVLRGISGFGANGLVHTTHVLSLSDDLPIAVIIVDTAERIEQFLPQLDEIIKEGLVIVDEVRVVHYLGGPDTDPQRQPHAPESAP